MKWMIATMLVGSTAVGGAAIQNEGTGSGNPETSTTSTSVALYGDVFPTFEEYANAQEEARLKAIADRREKKMERVVELVLNRVGKTPYVPSGASPSGWDCSGLVMWMYSKLGVTVPHSATAQLSVGKHVAKPRLGDIVVWGGGYHSGIYLGKGKVLNALNPNVDTNVVDVSYLGGSVTYVRAYNY